MNTTPKLLILLLCLVTTQLLAQPSSRSGQDYAIFFYVTKFQNRGWAPLPETKTEVTALANELRQNYGFQTELVGNPTKREIQEKITEVNNQIYGPDDQVLFFFSTHGHFDANSDEGFLIPADGKVQDQYGDTWISYAELGRRITISSCEHILLALDACYSGAFGDRYKGRPGDTPWANDDTDCTEQARRALQYDSRLYFTSGSREQRTPAQSLFAKRWLRALRQGAEKGLVRTNDLRYHLGTIESPTPEGGTFTNKHEQGGDFVFVHKNACKASVEKQLDQRHWNDLQANPSQAALLEHLRQYPGCPHYQQALNQLAAINNPKPPQQPADNGTKKTIPDNMVLVKGGTFQMGSADGSDDEKPVHSVTLSDYYIGRHEVTFADYDAFCNATGKTLPDDEGWGRNQHPVINVSWYDAVEYCNWLSEQHNLQPVYTISGNKVTANWNADGYRLPTEAEWEYAARSQGGKDKWAGTSSESNLASYANYYESGDKDGYKNTAPVGSFSANALGLHDMSGNVWEWCWDWYDSDYYGQSTDQNPKGPDTGSDRVLRGGSWYFNPAVLHCANRFKVDPDRRDGNIGFRLSRAAF